MRDAQTSATLEEAFTSPADAAHLPSGRFGFYGGHFDLCGGHFDQEALAVGHIDQPPNNLIK